MSDSTTTQPRPFRRFADGGAVGDVIPFYDAGAYHLFCLATPPDVVEPAARMRTSWRHLRSTDLVSWQELPTALSPGGPDEPDRDGVWTGSVVNADGRYHVFYTGHAAGATVPQTICHATSDDLVTFEKDRRNPILRPDSAIFGQTDWRDPFVFWNDEEHCYWMLISARTAAGAEPAKGCLAVSRSGTLVGWTAPEPLYSTLFTHCPECPEMFGLGNRVWLAYSRYSDRRQTVVRVADNPRGPWRRPSREALDGEQWYAAKSLHDEQGRRVAFGWVPDRPVPPATDWQWGGDLALPRELYVGTDGEIGGRIPEPVVAALGTPANWKLASRSRSWTRDGFDLIVDAQTGPARLIVALDGPREDFAVSCTLDGDFDTAGVVVGDTDELSTGLAVVVCRPEQVARIVDLSAPAAGQVAYSPVAEQRLSADATGTIDLTVSVRGDIVEAFLDDGTCLTRRLGEHDRERGRGAFAMLADAARMRFRDVTVRVPG